MAALALLVGDHGYLLTYFSTREYLPSGSSNLCRLISSDAPSLT